MKLLKSILFFAVINFGGLALGSWLMNNGPMSEWYLNLNQAPWTPPGWVFGVAWTTIMVCFSIYLAYLFDINKSPFLKWLFVVQVILNVSWNYIFFNLHMTAFGLLIIALLTLLIFYFFISFRTDKIQKLRLLLLPYMVWLLIATSLNAYIVFNN